MALYQRLKQRDHEFTGFESYEWPDGPVTYLLGQPIIMVFKHHETIQALGYPKYQVNLMRFGKPDRDIPCDSWLEVECILIEHTIAGKWIKLKERFRGWRRKLVAS